MPGKMQYLRYKKLHKTFNIFSIKNSLEAFFIFQLSVTYANNPLYLFFKRTVSSYYLWRYVSFLSVILYKNCLQNM